MHEHEPALVLAAWLAGLAGGSGHCLGMCGGIVGMLGLRADRGLAGLGLLFAAHAGRVLAYGAAGTVAGYAGAVLTESVLGARGAIALRGVAAVLVTALGLQLLLGRPLLAALERRGARMWRRLAPLMRGLVPPHDAPHAFAAGALWGFLPCGLVYAQLAIAAASGSAFAGGIAMAAFGVGTFVSLSVVGALLMSLGLGGLPRQASGALMLAFGVWIALPLLLLSGHAHDAATTATHLH